MQLVCPFFGSIQAYSPRHRQITARLPAVCPLCDFPRPEGKGVYVREVWDPGVEEIEVRRLRCRRPSCGVTISLLPSFCVPFKRYCSAIVESCLDSVLRCGERVEQWCEREGRTDRSTAGAWVRQFVDRSGLSSTAGAARLGFRQPEGVGGEAAGLWSALRRWARGKPVLRAVQPALCGRRPFLGLFRAPL